MQTQEELAERLGVTQKAVSKHLKAMGMIQKRGNWVPYEFRPRVIERRFFDCEQLLQRQNRKGFHITMCTAVKNGSTMIMPSTENHGECLDMSPRQRPDRIFTVPRLCIWWEHLAVVNYELWKPSETITRDGYRSHLMRLSRAFKEKRPQYQEGLEKMILQHDNARPHVARTVETYLETLKWEVLTQPPYSPNVASSGYHLFRSIAHDLAHQNFRSYEEVKK